MTPHALFVSDIDGTLLAPDGSLPPPNLRAILEATERGVVVALATGRGRSSFWRARDMLEGATFRGSISNGAVLLAADLHAPERVHAMAWDCADELARAGRSHARELILVASPEDEREDAYLLRPGGDVLAAHRIGDPATHRRTARDEPMSRTIVHAALHFDAREDAESLAPGVRERLAAHDVDVHVVEWPAGQGFLLEVVVSGGKGRAVRDLAEILAIPADRIGAVGDDMNDARLLDAAHHRYAVGGSVLAARHARATPVAPAEGAAVADALARFIAEVG